MSAPLGTCPSCQSSHLEEVLLCRDFLVSHQTFIIARCLDCDLYFTVQPPNEKDIPAYYESEAYISHTDTRKGLLNRAYHWARIRALRKKVRWVRDATGLSAGTVLDIGSGTGAFLNAMRASGWKTTGIEPNAAARKIAMDSYGIASYETLKLGELQAGSFDVITLWHVLEHVHTLHEYVELLKCLIKPDGKIIIALPNIQSVDFHFYREYWAALDVPRHLYHFTPTAVENLLRYHQLRIVRQFPMPFDPFYISLLSEKYRGKWGNRFRGLFEGFNSWLRSKIDWRGASSIVYVVSLS